MNTPSFIVAVKLCAALCICTVISILLRDIYIFTHPEWYRVIWLSCNKLAVSLCRQRVYQQSEGERLNWLLCMANLLSSLYIEVKADLCDCQYSSSSGLCYASEPAKWKQSQSHRKKKKKCCCRTVLFSVLANANARMSNRLRADVCTYLEAVTQTYTNKSG